MAVVIDRQRMLTPPRYLIYPPPPLCISKGLLPIYEIDHPLLPFNCNYILYIKKSEITSIFI
jgi:hypothetical protein